MPADHHYWFHAKRYGWGWGLPATWQGWLVMLAYLALAVFGTFLFEDRHVAVYLAYEILLGVAVLAIVWHKGEPPRWRWGDD